MNYSKRDVDELSFKIIGAAIHVHKELGPGLLESIYQSCFCEELRYRNLQVKTQISVPIIYRNKSLEAQLRIDVLIEDTIICELKAVEFLLPVHGAQLMSYMKLLEKPKGFLLNFHTENLTRNMKTFINEYYTNLS